jgi:hypothetical protein
MLNQKKRIGIRALQNCESSYTLAEQANSTIATRVLLAAVQRDDQRLECLLRWSRGHQEEAAIRLQWSMVETQDLRNT